MLATKKCISNSTKNQQDQWQNFDQQKSKQFLLERVIQEGLSQSKHIAYQAHWSFLTSIVLSTASTAISLTGAALLLLGEGSEGTVTTAVGLASGVYSYQLSKEAAERQQQANERLNRMLEHLYEIQPSD